MNKRIKKLLAMLLVCVLVGGAAPAGVVSASAAGVPAGYTGIYTPEDLDNVRNDLSGKYIQMQDINMSAWGSFEPIGSGKTANSNDRSNFFQGIFDGNGYAISGLEVVPAPENVAPRTILYVGLFGYTYGAEVCDLHLTGLRIDVTHDYYLYLGGIVGNAANGTTMRDCSVEGSVHGNDSTNGVYNYTGGFVGRGLATAENLHFSGDVSGIRNVGGIFGESTADAKFCTSGGIVGGTGNVGGIAGSGNFGSLDNCVNNAQVNADMGGSTGGIAGNLFRTLVTDCKNYGAVRSAGGDVGGIFGYGRSNGGVAGCENYGPVIMMAEDALGESNRRQFSMGGVGGYALDSNFFVRGCANYVDLEYTDTDPADYHNGNVGHINVGGVVGSLANGVMLYCRNFGSVRVSLLDNAEPYTYCGGVAGLSGGSPGGKIYQCFSIGDVSVKGGQPGAGGIVGSMGASDSIVKSYSHGDVKAQSSMYSVYAGGVAGIASSGTGSSYTGRYIGGNYHWGIVQAAGPSGYSLGGGIVGELSGAIIENNYFLQGTGVAVSRTTGRVLQLYNIELTAAQLKQESSFDKFDFTQDWEIVVGQNGDMPRLRSMQLPDDQRPGMPDFFGRAPYFTITLNAGSGTVSPTSILVYNGKPYNSDLGQLSTPTRSNYRFDGWFTASSGGTKVEPTDTVDLSGNITLYAHWTYAPTYTLTVVSGTGGGNYAIGTAVTISAYVLSGKVFDKWITISPGIIADPASATTTFTVPTGMPPISAITVTATYKDVPPATYLVTVTDGTADKATATAGETVTITAAAAPTGQRFKQWNITPAVAYTGSTNAASSTAKFTMPAGNVTVAAVYENIPIQPPSSPKGIFGTKPQYNQWWHYLLFFFCFGFIWMWF